MRALFARVDPRLAPGQQARNSVAASDGAELGLWDQQVVARTEQNGHQQYDE